MSTPTGQPSRRMESGTLWLFAAAAAVLAISIQLPALRGIFGALTTGRVPLNLVASTSIDGATGGAGPQLVSAFYDHATVVATGLSSAASALVIAGMIVGVLTAVTVGGAVVWFFLLLLWGRPFHRSLVGACILAGTALLLGGVLSTGLGGLGRMQAAEELNPVADGAFEVAFTFDPLVALVGVLILTLSFVFTRGSKLQQDTRGLV